MGPMNDPQVWTLIGVFATTVLGGMSVMTILLTRSMNSAIGRVHARIDGLRGEMRAGFRAVDARFEAMNVKIEHLDRDVQAIMRRQFGDGPL